MGALKWGLKATLCNLRTIVYNCTLLWPFGAHNCRGNFRRKMTTIVGNRGQLWTSALSPHLLAKPPSRLSRFDRWKYVVILKVPVEGCGRPRT